MTNGIFNLCVFSCGQLFDGFLDRIFAEMLVRSLDKNRPSDAVMSLL